MSLNFTSLDRDISECFDSTFTSRFESRAERKARSQVEGDRFIPSQENVEASSAALEKSRVEGSSTASSSSPPAKVLAFKTKAPAAPEGYTNGLKALYTSNSAGNRGPGGTAGAGASTRVISSTAERILDLPGLVDDFYINALDWSSNNLLGIALGEVLYLWNAADGSATELTRMDSPDNIITAVSFSKDGNYLALGLTSGEVQLWDLNKNKLMRTMRGHAGRVSSLSWNEHLLASGGKDGVIFIHDVRVKNHHVSSLVGHSQEVCQVKWSPCGTMLASGSNDNSIGIWEVTPGAAQPNIDGSPKSFSPKFVFTDHQAAVKALAWCPWQKNVLASGGGTADRCIKIWNTASGALVNSMDTGSQVCSLLFNPNERELLSSHGFSSNNLCVWRLPTMVRVKEIVSHTARVLHLAIGPDGTVVSAGADETLRFWRLFGDARPRSTAGAAKDVSGGPGGPGGPPPGLGGAGIR